MTHRLVFATSTQSHPSTARPLGDKMLLHVTVFPGEPPNLWAALQALLGPGLPPFLP